MPNNFKLVGDFYVSKAGSDSNNGLTPETPKRTVQAALNLVTTTNKTIIVGTGVYSEQISFINASTSGTIKADGYVVFEGTSTLSYFRVQGGGAGSNWNFDGIEFRKYNSIIGNQGANQNIFTNCVIKGLNHFFPGNNITHTNTIWINCNLIVYTTNTVNFNKCLFVNCSIGISQYEPVQGFTYIGGGINQYLSCCFLNSVIIAGSSISTTGFNYNNVYNSTVIMTAASSVTTGIIQDAYGRYYDLSIATSTGDGSIGNPYGRPYTNGAGFNFTNHRIAYPTMNASSSAVDPGFNNILKQDFTLQSSSPMVGRASDFINNIGGTPVATRLNASGSTFSGSNATVDNLVFSSFSDYVISGSATTGSVTSAPIFIFSSAKVIQEIDYNGLLAFNKDTTAPTGSNVNVPDVLTYTSASNAAGANPDRLTYYMRWTTGSSQPAADAQWENGGLWPAGSFNVFEWNTKPAVDFLGRGNGDQNFNIVNTPTYVKATWIQLRLSLRNNYLI